MIRELTYLRTGKDDQIVVNIPKDGKMSFRLGDVLNLRDKKGAIHSRYICALPNYKFSCSGCFARRLGHNQPCIMYTRHTRNCVLGNTNIVFKKLEDALEEL